MTYLVIYLLIGLALSVFTYYDEQGEDRRAILHPGFAAFFALLWPMIVVYMIHKIATTGVIRWKGKEIWRAKK